MNIIELANNSIKYLIAKDTTRDLAEAIVIAINNLKDKEGKFLLVRLSDDLEEHIDFCTQIAKQLRGDKHD